MEGAPSRRWPGVAVLSIAAAFSFWLMSGDPRLGALAALGAVLFGALLRARGRDRASEYYMMAAVIVVMAFVTKKCGSRRSGPDVWQDLAREYASAASPIGGIERQGDIHLIRHTSQFMVQPFRYRRAHVSFDSGGIFLSLSWPQTLVYDRLRVPVKRLTHCQEGERDYFGHTQLRILHPPVTLSVRDEDGRIRAWCREHEIRSETAPD